MNMLFFLFVCLRDKTTNQFNGTERIDLIINACAKKAS